MPKALISSQESVQNISSWKQIYDTDGETPITDTTPQIWVPIFTDIPNAQRVAQVEDNEFEVHSSLFWVDCNSSVTAEGYYYDSSDSTIKPITNAIQPE